MPLARTRPRRVSRAAFPAFAVLAVAFGAVVAFVLAPEHGIVRELIYGAARWLSVPIVIAGVRHNRPARTRSWALAILGTTLLVVGDAIWIAIGNPPVGEVGVPDVLYLVGYTLLAVGLGTVIEHRAEGINRPGLLDAMLLGVATGAATWQLVIDPITENPLFQGPAGVAAATYPVLDLVLVVVVARIALTTTRRQPALLLLLASVACTLGSDLLYLRDNVVGVYALGSAGDIGYVISPLLLAAATLHPSVARLVERRRGPAETHLPAIRLAAVGLAAAVPPAMLLLGQVDDELDRIALALGSLAALGLVIVRLSGVLTSLRTVVAKERRMEAMLRERATYDPLTSLLNRAAFVDTLAASLARTGRDRPAVLFLDLDDFKTVNDTFGHAAGDELLLAVASRLRASVRPDDAVARFGGDEFAVLLPSGGAAGARAVAQRVLDAFTPDFTVADRPMSIGASIGIALATDATAVPSELLRQADIAMYLAKRGGQARYEIFEPTMHGAVVEAIELRSELTRALERGEFVLHYQPLWTAGTRELMGFEALVRWQHPERGLLGPGAFVPAAEETGLIVPLGRWVLETAARQLHAWHRETGLATLVMHVNVSVREIAADGFVEDVRRTLERTGVDPACVLLELTESAFLERALASRRLAALTELGVRLGIDDFGTGYSSLSYLARLPISVIKLDRRFASGDAEERAKLTILARGVVAIANELGMHTVAEGIEAPEQLAVLEAMGVRGLQGYLLGRPQPAPAIEAWLLEPEVADPVAGMALAAEAVA